MPADQVIDPTVWAESWSGYCLDRSSSPVVPWVIPMVVTNRPLVDPVSGAIRFWYRPGFDSGSGPGNMARLLTLASGSGGTSAVWWSLVVSPDGSTISLACQSGNDLVPCLSATVAFQAGNWYLVMLGYSETNSAIFINDALVVSGGGLPAVPAQVVSSTSLIVGSGVLGQEVAAGQIDELSVFSGSRRFRRITGSPFGMEAQQGLAEYYNVYSATAALGPITPEAEAAQAQMRAERSALRQRSGMARVMGRAGQEGPQGESPPPCGTNDTYTVWMTNTVCSSLAGEGWTVSFTIAGGASGVVYDVFCATNLVGNCITNSQWWWVTNGCACDTITLTNQTEGGCLYILGTPLDSDGDGITDAYSALVYGGLGPDSNGNGVPDWLEILMGYDPRQPNDLGKSKPGYGLFLAQPGNNSQLP